jgi:hypothetical protein
MQALLESPRLTASEREALWLCQRKLTQKLGEQEQAQSPPKARAIDPDAFTWEEQNRAGRRARLAVELLQFGGVAQAEPLGQSLRAGKATDWHALGEELRKIWARLAEGIDKEPNRPDREHLERILDPLQQLRPGPRNDTARIRAEQTKKYWAWLAQRYGKIGSLAGSGDYGKFCTEVANDYQLSSE